MFFNSYIENISAYKLPAKNVWNEVENVDLLKLDWNETSIAPSPKVKAGILEFLDKGRLNWYPDINNEMLVDRIANYSGVSTKNVNYFAGSDSLHEYLVRAFLRAGDSVMIVGPTYDHFRALAESFGVTVSYYYLDEDYSFNDTLFSQALAQAKPKVVYLVSPNNPTGTEYDADLIESLLAQFPDTLFIIDEAYYEFSNNTVKDLIFDFINLIVTRTFSKAFGLASFRIGYCLACENIINGLNKIRNPKSISAMAQLSAFYALDDLPYMRAYVDQVARAKKEFSSCLNNLGIRTIVGGGNYIMIEAREPFKTAVLSAFENNSITVRDFSDKKGLINMIRITVGTLEQMHNVFKIIESAFDSTNVEVSEALGK